MTLPTEEDKRWMAHYWDQKAKRVTADGRTLPPSKEKLRERIAELAVEIERREKKGEPHDFLLGEMVWRQTQLEQSVE